MTEYCQSSTRAKPQVHPSSFPSDPSSTQANLVSTPNLDGSDSIFCNLGSGGGFRGHGGRRRGCGRFGNIQCQVCFRFGHIASMCYYRFNQQYQAPVPADFQMYQGYSQGSPSQGNFSPNGFANRWMHPPNQPRPPFAIQRNALLTNSTPFSSSAWFPDSGASFPCHKQLPKYPTVCSL